MKTLQASIAFVAVSLCLASCHEHDHPTEVIDEHHTAQTTVWEDGLEAFIEYEYPVATLPVRFITHVSDIATGEPRREGAITFAFEGPSGQPLTHREDRVARDGIYLPSITFPEAGSWKATLRVPASVGETRELHLPDITVYANEEAALGAAAPEEVEGISFLKEQQWKLSMRTATATTKTLSARRKFPAHVLHKTGHRVSVSSPVAGRLVGLDGVEFPSRGRVVHEGDVLALVEPTLPSSDLLLLTVKVAEAEAAELRAAQALKLAEATLARVTRLQKSGAKSARELEQARFDAEAARTAQEAAVAIKSGYQRARSYTEAHHSSEEKSSEDFGRLAVRAPISGTVVHVETAPGERVTPASTLFVILDSSAVYVEAEVPQHEAPSLGTKPQAYLEVHGENGSDAARQPLSLLYSGLEVEEATHAVPLLYEASNTDGLLRVGMLVDVYVEVAAPRQAVSVPESALVDEDGRNVVFVQLSGETFEKRELSLGIRDGGMVEVLDGLVEGERVATTEAWSIRLASLATVIPEHGHEH